MKKPKQPTIRELIEIVDAYNVARTNELRVVPLPFPSGYKNPLMDSLYDAADLAVRQLKSALEDNLEIKK